MFSFIAGIVSLKWISEHSTEIIIGVVILLWLIIHSVTKRKKQILEAQAAYARQQAELHQAKNDNQTAYNPNIPDKSDAVHAPYSIDGYILKYSYPDVELTASGITFDAHKNDKLNFVDDGSRICVMIEDTLIGYMPQNRLEGMVKDWLNAGDPFLGYYVGKSEKGPVIALFFYSDIIGRFLAKNPDAKLYKLTGKPEEYAVYEVGYECTVEEDPETEKLQVVFDGSIIGCLPPSAITYIKSQDLSPEDVNIIIGKVDYDAEKGRDYVSVYID